MEQKTTFTEDSTGIAMVLSRCINALGLLASPLAWSKIATRSGADDLREGIIESLDQAHLALEALSPERETEASAELVTGAPGPRTSELLGELMECSGGWEVSDPPQKLVVLAQSCLAELGVPEPDGGWECFAPDAL